MTDRTYYIYLYTFPNGKKYVGETYHGSNRFGVLSHYRGQLVYNAMKKYPLYEKTILMDNLTSSTVDYWERYFIKKYKTNDRKHGYNRESGGHKHKVVSAETKKLHQRLDWREKISASKRGHDVSQETRQKLSKSHKGISTWNKGGHLNEEWRKKLSDNRNDKISVLLDNKLFFTSITECAKHIHAKKCSVSAVVNGKRKSVYGHTIKKCNLEELKQ